MSEFGITIDPEAIEAGARLLRDAWSMSARQTLIGYDDGAAVLRAGSLSTADLDHAPARLPGTTTGTTEWSS